MTPLKRAAVDLAPVDPAAPPTPLAAPVVSGVGTPSSSPPPFSSVPRGVAARVQTPPGSTLPAKADSTDVLPGGSIALSAGQMAIAEAMSEDRGPDSLEAHMRRLMEDLDLWGYHPRRSEKSEKGWPDWVIIGTRIVHRELKTERGKVTDEQEAVGARITRAGGDWDVWRPRDLLSGRIAEELRAITAGPLGLGDAA